MRKPVVEFNNFGVQYASQKNPTLHDISLTIYEGEKVLILGPSGCGKSTLGNCINGLLPFLVKCEFTGSLKVLGEETRKQDIHKLSYHIGTVLQDMDAQFVGLSVGEDVAFSLENDCVSRDKMTGMVKTATNIVGMTDFLNATPYELSGGQKQKVSLAGILHNDVDMLLFDEPLAALDPKTGVQTIELIDNIHKEKNKTVIIIEHRLEDVLHCDVDRIILMSDGKIMADTTPDEILCTNMLGEYGIREPLYITALKNAGCEIKPEDHPSSVRNINLEDKKQLVVDWFNQRIPSSSKEYVNELIHINNVSFSYGGRTALKDINITISQNERIALIGKNGAGKSTLASLLMGVIRPNRGHILIEGKDYMSLSIKQIGERIGYVMQNPNQMIIKDMIKDEVALALKMRNTSTDEIEKKVAQVLELCGLYSRRNWPISALSYGQKKRITIASLLVIQPKVLILDEPTAGQDYHHYREIMEFLDVLNQEFGTTIIFITHDMHLAMEYTDRAIVLADGVIIGDGDIFSIIADDSIIKTASLKETSLYHIAKKVDLDPESFVRHFIQYERAVMKCEQ